MALPCGAVLRRFAQRRQAQLGAEEDAGQVDRAEPFPFGEAGGFDILAEKQPGIVDQDVELAEAVEDGGDRGVPILLARHVEMHVERRVAERLAPSRDRVRRARRRSPPWRRPRPSAARSPRRCRAPPRRSAPPCRRDGSFPSPASYAQWLGKGMRTTLGNKPSTGDQWQRHTGSQAIDRSKTPRLLMRTPSWQARRSGRRAAATWFAERRRRHLRREWTCAGRPETAG